MKCDAQGTVKLDKPIPDGKGGLIYNIPYSCGKCYACKQNVCSQWGFRMMEEFKVSQTAFFVTLTYDTMFVPITKRGFMTLKKLPDKKPPLMTKKQWRKIQLEKDVSAQGFIKRLRYYEKKRKNSGISSVEYNAAICGGSIDRNMGIKYLAVGEYGSKRKRPHLHLILFNVLDLESIYKAWPFGDIHIDDVNNNTVQYCLKYVMKPEVKKKKGFDGEKEFRLISKGIGQGFVNKQRVRFYNNCLDSNFVYSDEGYKVPMPKYYRERLLTKENKVRQIAVIKEEVEKLDAMSTDKKRMIAADARNRQLMKSQKRNVD